MTNICFSKKHEICLLAYLTLSSAFYSATIFSHSTIYIYRSAFTPWGPRINCKSIHFHLNNPVSTYLMVHLLIVEPSSMEDISSNLNFMWRGSPRWIMILSVLTLSWVSIKGIKTQNITIILMIAIDDSTRSLSSLC